MLAKCSALRKIFFVKKCLEKMELCDEVSFYIRFELFIVAFYSLTHLLFVTNLFVIFLQNSEFTNCPSGTNIWN